MIGDPFAAVCVIVSDPVRVVGVTLLGVKCTRIVHVEFAAITPFVQADDALKSPVVASVNVSDFDS